MKKFLILLLIPLFSACDFQIENQQKLDKAHLFFDGKHQLQRMGSTKEFRASFFLFGGTASEKQTVSFSWLSYDGIYNFTTLSLDQLRVKIVPGKEPTIEFLLESDERLVNFDYPQDIDIAKYWIENATVECDEKYWQPNVNLPLGE